ncbi:MAG: YdbH domain-containing protein [Planctomycetota bacterium]
MPNHDGTTLPSAARRRRRPRWRVALLVGALLVAGLVGAGWALAPRWIGARVCTALEQLGFVDVRLQGTRLSFDRLVVEELVMGRGGALRVGRVLVEFGLRDLLAARVDTVVLENVDWDPARAGADAAQWAPLDELTGTEAAGATAATTAAASPALPALPLRALLLQRLNVRLPRATLEELLGDPAPVQRATARCALRIDAGEWRVELRATGLDQRLDLRAHLTPSADGAAGQWRVTAGADDAELLQMSGALRLGRVPGRPLGRTIELDVATDTADFALGPVGRDVDIHGLEVRGRVALEQRPAAAGWAARWEALVQPAAGTSSWEVAGGGIPEGLRGLLGSGRLELRGELAPGGAPRHELRTADFGLRTDDWQLAGVAAELAVPAAPEPTPAPSNFSWHRLTLGTVRTEAGTAHVAVTTDPLALRVDRAEWFFAADGGRAKVEGVTVDPAAGELRARVELEGVPLDPVLAAASEGRLRGDGRIDGWLAASLAWQPSLRLRLDDGTVRAGGGGTLRFRDDPETRAMLTSYAAPIAAQAANEQQREVVQERIVDSLRNFAFTVLGIVLERRPEDLTLRVRLAGKGRDVPQELDLNVNLHGVDALVDLAFDAHGRARQAADRVGQTPADAAQNRKDR